MPDQQSVMKQYRYLDEKRVADGLTPDEQARYEQLRALVAPGARAAQAGAGFDVNAAAAQLRESLLPAGLRNRPPPTPVAIAAPEPEPEAGSELSAADALAYAYPAQPFDALEGAPPAEADALFDPAQLGFEPAPGDAYDPNAAPYDPNAAPYDPNAGYDPNAQAAWDPNQPWDPNAFPADPATQPYDPNALPYDPNAASDPAAGYAPDAQAGWDPNRPWDPNAFPADASAIPNDPGAAYDPNAQAAWDPNQPWDPATLAADGAAQPYDPNITYDDPNAPPYEPSAEPFELAGEAGAAPASGANAWETAAPGEGVPAEAGLAAAAPWDVEDPERIDAGPPLEADAALAPEPVDAGFAVSPESDAMPEPFGADDAIPAGWHTEPPLPERSDAPLGEYDETGGAIALAPDGEPEALPFDAPPESYDPAGDAPEEHAPLLGEYDDTAGFSGPGGAAPEMGAPPEDPEAMQGGELAPPADVPEHGFSLESDGSFGAGGGTGGGESAADSAAPPWENGPPFDLGAPHAPPPGDGSGYELAPPDGEPFGALEGAPLAEPAPGDLADEGETPSFEPPSPEGGLAPELDFSQPDFSAEEDAFVEAFAPAAELRSDPASAPFDAGPGATDPAELAQLLPEAAATEAQAARGAEEGAAELPAAALDPGALDFDVDTDEDIPTIEATDIIEEIPEESPVPPPRSLDFEPLAPIAAAAEAAYPSVAEATPAEAPADVAPPPPDDATALAASPLLAASAAASPPPAPAPFRVAGTHRVVVHTVEGQVKRGILEEPDLASPILTLASQPGQPGEQVAMDKVKAIFFMLAPGEKAPAPEGKKVRVTFHDGRQVAGFSPDYDESGVGFFMFPGDTRTNTGRIWVYRSAVRQVTVS